MDDSLDKLIGRTEANYIVESNDQVLEKEEKPLMKIQMSVILKRLTFKKH